mgnify:CR=1 FL=1
MAGNAARGRAGENSLNAASDHAGANYVVREGAYPELTWHAVVVGWLLGALISVSIGYAALILGFSIEGSELAAILGFAIGTGFEPVRFELAHSRNVALCLCKRTGNKPFCDGTHNKL